MRSAVDYQIGDWMIKTDEGEHAILVVKDIHGFMDALTMAKIESTSAFCEQHINDAIDLVEFAPVDIIQGNTIQWQGG
jgi:hypothetical protein